MKIIAKLGVVLIFLLPILATARGFIHYPRFTHISSAGSVHWVRPYTTRRGVYHRGHLSGNPYSGVHCHNNICY